MVHLIIRRVFSIVYLTVFVSITLFGQSSLNDLNIILKHDFEDNTVGNYLPNEWERDWFSPAWNSRQSTTKIVQEVNDLNNPTKALQLFFPANSLGPEEGGTQWFTNINKCDELYISYDLYFMPGFKFQQGGKLPSIQGGNINASVKPTGYDGFTGGLMFKEDGKINFYIYYPDSKVDEYGQSFLWGASYLNRTPFLPSSVVYEYSSGETTYCVPGVWHNITYRMVLNSIKSGGGGNYDGILEAYFDGKLVTQFSHFLFRHTDDIAIDCMRIYSFFGGSTDDWRNPIAEWLKIDNVLLYTFKEGIEVPRGNNLSPTNRTINYWRNFESDHTNAPASPFPLSQTDITSSSLGLKWTDNSNNEQGFAIYRSTSATEGFVQIGTVPANITDYTDTTVDLATTYYYRVLAFNSIVNSSFSNTISVTTLDNPAFPYKMGSVIAPCNSSDFFDVPLIKTTVDTLEDCIGFDLVMIYDNNKVKPTGKIQFNNDLVGNISLTDYAVGIYDTLIAISIYLNAGDVSRARFSGTGQVLAVEFRKTMDFNTGDTARFTVASLAESYATSTKSSLVEPGIFSTYCDSIFKGALRFWSDSSPIGYNQLNKDSTFITNIFVTDTSGNRISENALQPDISGNFECVTGNGKAIQIERDIPGDTDMMPVINGIDVQMVRKVLVQDNSFIPNIYQIIAMDVNMDGNISAGDITQMNQRAMSQINEYQQAWNNDFQGVSNGTTSKDWLFIPGSMLSSGENFRISATYPLDDHKGYSKYRVPLVPNNLLLPVEVLDKNQPMNTEIYSGILLGDVDGNYRRVTANPGLKSTSGRTNNKAIFDLSSALIQNGNIDIPISIQSDTPVYSLDFTLKVNEKKIRYQSVVAHAESLQYHVFYNTEDQKLRLTSNSLQQISKNKPLLTLRFALISGQPEASDILSANLYLNGEPGTFKVSGKVPPMTENLNEEEIKIYPNPASSFLFIEAPAKSTVQVLDITGGSIYGSIRIDENPYKLDIQDLHSGIYLVKVQYDHVRIVKKVIVNH